ncbi:MAG TPA: ABC transporter permease [Aggregatilineales bacterium]|nr:ABC transporter permease [Aggregatilineales bacterium]
MIAFLENMRVALTGLLSNKLRAGLTMLGISIGVAAVIVLISLGQAVQDYVAAQFLGIGANLAFVGPTSLVGVGSGLSTGRRAAQSLSFLSERDQAVLADPLNVPDANAVTPVLSLTRVITYSGQQTRARVHATLPTYLNARQRAIALGRFIDEQDVTDQARVAVIGLSVIRALFPAGTLPLDETIAIAGVNFRVVGVLGKYGGTSFGTDEDNLIIIPLASGLARLQTRHTPDGSRPLTFIYLQAPDEKTIDAVVAEATNALRKAHHISFRDDDDFRILTQKDLLQSFGQIAGLLTAFLGAIAGISLLVGGIGIMNIMLVTVTERTHEIGLRKAVGARNGDVLVQFLIEATMLALSGGGIGLLIATLGMLILRFALPTLNATIHLDSVLLATTISAAIGIFFGLYPASRASRLNPIDALRFE